MPYNYGQIGSPALQKTFPLFGNVANKIGVTKQSNFLPQIPTSMQSANAPKKYTYTGNLIVPACPSTPAAPSFPSYFSRKRRPPTPEPPPAPRLSDCIDINNASKKSDQGAQPMDLEIDDDIGEVAESTQMKATIPGLQKISGPNTNLLLNALMGAGINPSLASYMFFPSAPGSMLMDQATIMAMQQMQGYGGYVPATVGANASMVAESSTPTAPSSTSFCVPPVKEIIKTKHCTLFPPNPHAAPPTIRERPPGCRTVFVGGLPEATTEELIREIFEPCGEINTLRMSKKNFCHIRYRLESSIDQAIFLSGYRMRISNVNDPTNFGRLHVDYAQARDDQYEYECKQRQLQRERRHRDRSSLDRRRSQSPPPIPHYTDHEASLLSECLRSNDSFIKAVQTVTIWLERGDCNKRNTNTFYSMIQSTHAHVRRLHSEKQQLEDDLKKARESYRKKMLIMSKQFTQIEKVFNAASHKKVWDHFSKAQRKNIDQWKKIATELRSIQIEDDEMEMSDEDRADYSSSAKRSRYDTEHLKDENDSLRCQLEAVRNEMSLERADLKYNTDFREKQIKVLQETIRNMQTQLMRIKVKEQRDAKTIGLLERRVKESGVKQLLLKTKIRETAEKMRDRGNSSRNSETSEIIIESNETTEELNEHEPGSEKEERNSMNDRTVLVDDYQNDVVEILDTDEVEIIEEKRKKKTKPREKAQSIRSANVAKDDTEEEPRNLSTEKLDDDVDAEGQDNIKHTLLPTEARIIALVTAFLIVHPWGATSDYICDYLRESTKSNEWNATTLDGVLNTYTNIFKATPKLEKSSDTNVVMKWHFCGYDGDNVENDSSEMNNRSPQ